MRKEGTPTSAAATDNALSFFCAPDDVVDPPELLFGRPFYAKLFSFCIVAGEEVTVPGEPFTLPERIDLSIGISCLRRGLLKAPWEGVWLC